MIWYDLLLHSFFGAIYFQEHSMNNLQLYIMTYYTIADSGGPTAAFHLRT
jgi:hypothetical protein